MTDEVAPRVEQSRYDVPAAVTVPVFGGMAVLSFAVSLHELAFGAPVYTPLEALIIAASLLTALVAFVVAYREAWHADVRGSR